MSDANKIKYRVSDSQSEEAVLNNLLDLKTEQEINNSEFEGFLRSERILIETLSTDTDFDLKYIKTIHKYALYHLYSFAGQYRTVNISKEGFFFPPARYIPESMESFEKTILKNLKSKYNNKNDLIEDIAVTHGELLFIHPFREGNGRTSRILANMMAYKAGFDRLKFEEISSPDKFEKYVLAVQKSGIKDYSYMIEIIQGIF